MPFFHKNLKKSQIRKQNHGSPKASKCHVKENVTCLKYWHITNVIPTLLHTTKHITRS